MFWIVWAVVGVVVWAVVNYWLTGDLTGKSWWTSLIAALVGSWLGDLLLGDWAWIVAGFNVIAGVIGAALLTWLWHLASKNLE